MRLRSIAAVARPHLKSHLARVPHLEEYRGGRAPLSKPPVCGRPVPFHQYPSHAEDGR